MTNYKVNAYDVMFCQLGLRHITHIPYYSYQEPGFSDLENRYVDTRKTYHSNMMYLANKASVHLPTENTVKKVETRSGARTFRIPKGRRR